LYLDGDATTQLGQVILKSSGGVLFSVEVTTNGFSLSTANRSYEFEGPDCTGAEFIETGVPGSRADPTIRFIQSTPGIDADGSVTFVDPSEAPTLRVSLSFRNNSGCTNQLEPVQKYGRPLTRVDLRHFVTPFSIR
jgi:hypothetical protein